MDNFDKAIQESLKQAKKNIECREEYNLKILEYLDKKIREFPTLRFGQLLTILGLNKIEFYEESINTYKNLVNT